MVERAPWEEAAAPAPQLSPEGERAPWEAAPETAVAPDEPPMPGVMEAGIKGLGAAIRGVKQTATISSTAPQPEEPESPAAAPFELRDIQEPFSRGLPKVAYRMAEGAPTLAAGVAGGLAGAAAAGPPGAIAGGAGGAALGSVAQSLGPIFAAEMKKTPDNPDAAWDSAVKQAAAAGLFSAAGWAAFPLRVAGGPLKQMVFQAFGVQPAISMGHKATENVITGKPVTEGLGEAYTSGAVMTAIPAAGHGLVSAFTPKPPLSSNLTGPRKAVADRMTSDGGWERRTTFDDAYTNLKDELHPIKVVQNAIMELSGTRSLPTAEAPYDLARLTRGNSGRSTAWIDFETFDFNSGRTNGQGLRQILGPAKDRIDEFTTYLTAKRTIDLEGRGIKTGVPLAEAQWVVQADRGRFEPIAQRLYGYQNRLVDYLKHSGVLNDEQVAAMRQANKDYVPFYRLMEEGEGPSGVGAGAGLNPKNPIRGIKGSERQIINPLESIIKNTHMMIDLAERNRVAGALVNLAERTPGADQFIQKSRAQSAPVELSQNEMQRLLNLSGVPANYGPPSNFTVFRPKAFRAGDNEFVYFRDGKREVWEAPRELAQAFKGMDTQNIGMIQKMASMPARVLRAGVTLAPDFFVRNMIRDQLTAFAFSKNGYIPLYDYVKGMRQVMGGNFDAWLESRNGSNAVLNAIAAVLGKGEKFKEWMRSGGANAALVSGDRNYVAGEIRRLTESGSFNGMKGLVRNPLNALQAMSELMESATRVAEFANARRYGKSLAEAGLESRDITIDFWRIGAKTRALNNITAFWNASVEGLDRTAKAFRERPVATPLKVIGSVGLTSFLLGWANHGDKRIEELPAWERDFFWHIPTDKWTQVSQEEAMKAPEYLRREHEGKWFRNDGTIYKIPKNFELGLIFGSVPERIFEAYWKQNPDAWRNVGESFQRAFMLEPSSWMPTALSPVLEQITNYSLFTKRDLIPESMSGRNKVEAKYQYNPYTSESAKLIGKGLGSIVGDASIASPIVIENYIRAWTGTLGMTTLRGADAVLTGSGVVKAPSKPEETMADKFFVRGFVSRYPSASAESIQKFYDNYNESKVKKNTINFLNKRVGLPEEAQRYAAENTPHPGETIYNALNAQQKQLRTILNDKNKTPIEKRRMMDDTYFQMIKIAREGNKMFRDLKKKPAPEKAPWEQ